MKVGTDGVLLGAWAGLRPADRRILDIGAGTGLIALMMAQRAPEARITGVDVEDVAQARENAAASPWGGRVAFEQCPVQEFAPDERFDLIVSNPPFFVGSLTCPDEGRTTARHAVRLPFDQLRDAVVRLLADDGRFAVILPTDEARRFTAVCRGFLALTRCTGVRTTPRRPVKRMLMEFAREKDCAASPAPDPALRTGLSVASGSDGCPATAVASSAAFDFAGSSAASVAPFAAPDSVAAPETAISAFPSVSACSGLRFDYHPAYSELVIGTGLHEQYTPEYRALTRDFYLKF